MLKAGDTIDYKKDYEKYGRIIRIDDGSDCISYQVVTEDGQTEWVEEYCIIPEVTAGEIEAELAAEQMAHLVFHFPGSFGPHAGPDPEDARERELEALYWEESERHSE